MEAFWKDGFHAASLSTIEEATGVGRRSLLNTFGDKRLMFIEVLKDFREHAASRFLAPMEKDDAGLRGIRETLDLLSAEARTEAGRLGCLICNTAREPIAEDREINEQIWFYFRRIERAFAKALSTAAEKGEISADIDIEKRAQSLLGTVVSLCTLARAGAPSSMTDTIAAEAIDQLR